MSLPTEDTRDLIWTKDNIMVRSIYVSNVKPIVTIQDLRNVFEPFGAIYEVVILQTAHPDKRVTYNAIVTFLDAESATNLLRCKFPQICYGKRLYVKQALSVNQPVDLLNGKILYNQDDIFNYNLKNYYYLNGFTNNSHLMINNRNMQPANQSHSTDSYYENSYEYNYTPNNMDNSTWRNMYYPTTSVLNNAVPWNQQFHEPIINQISETILEKLKTLNQRYQKAPYPQLYPQERYQQENDSMTINTIFEQEAIRRSNFFQSSPKSDVDANYLSRYYKAFGEHDRSESTIN